MLLAPQPIQLVQLSTWLSCSHGELALNLLFSEFPQSLLVLTGAHTSVCFFTDILPAMNVTLDIVPRDLVLWHSNWSGCSFFKEH